jgi:hypothetical protein
VVQHATVFRCLRLVRFNRHALERYSG